MDENDRKEIIRCCKTDDVEGLRNLLDNKRINISEKLIVNDYDEEQYGGTLGQTALHIAANSGSLGVVQFITKNYARVYENLKDECERNGLKSNKY